MSETRPTVLITGVSGLIGHRLARALARDHEVIGLDVAEPPAEPPAGGLDPEPGPASGSVHFIACDLTSDASTEEALDTVERRLGGRSLASVVHLAAYYDFSGAPSPLYRTLTVEGTRRLLVGLRERTPPEQFVFSSSLLVMRPARQGQLLAESSPVEAEWDYPRSKLEAEDVIAKERDGIPAVIVRLAGVYDEGGHSPPLTQQIWRIREKKLERFLFPGDPGNGQSFVHLDDAVSALAAIVARRDELPAWDLFLVGEPDVMTYAELQDEIGERLHGRAWPTLRIPAAVAKAGAWVKDRTPLGGDEEFIKPWMIDLADSHYPVSIAHARRRLGWTPRHRLRDTLPSMLEQLEADPRAWYEENDLPLEDAESGDRDRRSA